MSISMLFFSHVFLAVEPPTIGIASFTFIFFNNSETSVSTFFLSSSVGMMSSIWKKDISLYLRLWIVMPVNEFPDFFPGPAQKPFLWMVSARFLPDFHLYRID